MACSRCGLKNVYTVAGLCTRCRRTDPDRPRCQHCNTRAACRPKCLCWPCSKDPAIRTLYPPKKPYGQYAGTRVPDTEAELDALIAEQMKCLPSWWREEWPHSRGDR